MDLFWLARKGKEATEEESKEGVVGVAGLTKDTNTHFHTVANTPQNLQLHAHSPRSSAE